MEEHHIPLRSYTEDIHGVYKQLRDLRAKPLVPGTVPVHVLSGGRDVKNHLQQGT